MANNGDFRQDRIFTHHPGGRGRGGGQWPPPFDEWIGRFRRRFGGGGGGPTGEALWIGWALLVIVGLVAVFTSFYTVDVSEEAVVTRFERYHSTTPSGLHFKLPFFIDRVVKVPSKVLLQEEFGFRSAGQNDD